MVGKEAEGLGELITTVDPMLEGHVMAKMMVLDPLLEIVMVEMAEGVAFSLWLPIPGNISQDINQNATHSIGFGHNAPSTSRGRRIDSVLVPRSPSSPKMETIPFLEEVVRQLLGLSPQKQVGVLWDHLILS